jgi:hypothetical protein
MRVTSKDTGDAFAQNLASHICDCHNDHHVVIKKNASDLSDEATQSAITYWMMGWTWDEIETVLADSEYTDKIISTALKNAKEYAKEVLNSGPFGIFEAGQGVKLVNGSLGVLQEKRADHLDVHIYGYGTVQVDEAHIDIEATKELSKAFALRTQAASEIKRQQSPMFSFTAADKIYTEAHSSHVDFISNSLNEISTVYSNILDISADSRKLINRWRGEADTWVRRSTAELEFTQFYAACVSEEARVDEAIKVGLSNIISPLLTDVYDTLTKKPELLDDASFASSIQYINGSLKETIRVVEGELDRRQRRNDTIRNIPIRSVGNSVLMVKDFWDKTKAFNSVWDSNIKHDLLVGVKTLANFLAATTSEDTKERVQAALNVLV